MNRSCSVAQSDGVESQTPCWKLSRLRRTVLFRISWRHVEPQIQRLHCGGRSPIVTGTEPHLCLRGAEPREIIKTCAGGRAETGRLVYQRPHRRGRFQTAYWTILRSDTAPTPPLLIRSSRTDSDLTWRTHALRGALHWRRWEQTSDGVLLRPETQVRLRRWDVVQWQNTSSGKRPRRRGLATTRCRSSPLLSSLRRGGTLSCVICRRRDAQWPSTQTTGFNFRRAVSDQRVFSYTAKNIDWCKAYKVNACIRLGKNSIQTGNAYDSFL